MKEEVEMLESLGYEIVEMNIDWLIHYENGFRCGKAIGRQIVLENDNFQIEIRDKYESKNYPK